jgi:hypothetical protein
MIPSVVSFLRACFGYFQPFKSAAPASFLVGYTSDDLLYKWTTGRGVNIASDMKLSQFDLISTPTGNETTLRNRGTATRNHVKQVFGTPSCIHSAMD